MATHTAVATTALGKIDLIQVPTPTPVDNQVRVRCEWTASTPLELHQADGGLLVRYPQVLGDGVAGEVVEVGPKARLSVGDKVFGFTWRNQAEKAHQTYVVAPDNLLGKIPDGFSMQQAVVLGNNFVTAYHTLTKDFGFELPWPRPENYVPKEAEDAILIWGGSSSCGQYALQLLKYFGYRNVITTASQAHHEKLKKYGATRCFDYRHGDVIKDMHAAGEDPKYVLDCIGSASGSVQPIARLVHAESKVAVLLPVIVKDAAEGVAPEYAMEVEKAASWSDGVEVMGVRTHFYLDNQFLADKLQSEVMPSMLAQGVIEPNDQKIVEGKTLLERAEKALSMLRRKEVSGARLVWKVSD